MNSEKDDGERKGSRGENIEKKVINHSFLPPTSYDMSALRLKRQKEKQKLKKKKKFPAGAQKKESSESEESSEEDEEEDKVKVAEQKKVESATLPVPSKDPPKKIVVHF